MSTLESLLNQGQTLLNNLPHPDLDTRILLRESISLSEEQLIVLSETVPGKKQERLFFRLIQKRQRGFPLAYLTGRKEFWSLDFEVNRNVLIPRPETELIVEKAVKLLKNREEIVVDIGTGCGNIAVSLAREFQRPRILATDISKKALITARRNAQRHRVSRVEFYRGDMFAPLSKLDLENRCDIIVSNPPYVSEEDWKGLSAEIREHEPKTALVSGETGLECIEDLICGAGRYLKPGGYLLFEVGAGQKKKVKKLFRQDWDDVRCFDDLNGIPRVFAARKTS